MKLAVLGHSTENIGDDIQTVALCTLLPHVDYIICRDDARIVVDFHTGAACTIEEPTIVIMAAWMAWEPVHLAAHPVPTCKQLLFPFSNPLLTPLFISTCLAREPLWTPECIRYYKQHEPFLARDQYTADRLQKCGVRAEYFGCITQAIDATNIRTLSTWLDKDVFVDTRGGKPYVGHMQPELKSMTLKQRLDCATKLLGGYKGARSITTSRLHCFLPCRSMGLQVQYTGPQDFRTKELTKRLPDVNALRSRLHERLREVSGGSIGIHATLSRPLPLKVRACVITSLCAPTVGMADKIGHFQRMPDVDYFCVTNLSGEKLQTSWTVIPLNTAHPMCVHHKLGSLAHVKQSRMVKFIGWQYMHHVLRQSYDVVMFCDATRHPAADLRPVISAALQYGLVQNINGRLNNTLAMEMESIVKYNKDTPEHMSEVRQLMDAEAVPFNAPVYLNSCFAYCVGNKSALKILQETWQTFSTLGTVRDQPIHSITCHRHKFTPHTALDMLAYFPHTKLQRGFHGHTYA